MRLVGVNHIQITIPSGAEDAARHFYCVLLGLTETPKPAVLTCRGGFWLLAGKMPVHIGAEDGLDRAASKAHVAYEVEDLPGWQQHLRLAGVTILDSVPIPGFARFECRDPFGNRVELIEPLATTK